MREFGGWGNCFPIGLGDLSPATWTHGIRAPLEEPWGVDVIHSRVQQPCPLLGNEQSPLPAAGHAPQLQRAQGVASGASGTGTAGGSKTLIPRSCGCPSRPTQPSPPSPARSVNTHPRVSTSSSSSTPSRAIHVNPYRTVVAMNRNASSKRKSSQSISAESAFLTPRRGFSAPAPSTPPMRHPRPPVIACSAGSRQVATYWAQMEGRP